MKELNRTRENPDPLPQQHPFPLSRKFLSVSEARPEEKSPSDETAKAQAHARANSSPRPCRRLTTSSPPPRHLLAASSPLPRRLLSTSFPPACSQSVSSPSVSSPSASSPSASTRCRGLLAARPPPRCLSPRRPPASSPPTRLPHCPPASSPSASTFSRHADTPADTPRLLLASSRHILASSPHHLILTVLPHRHASMCLRSTSSHA